MTDFSLPIRNPYYRGRKLPVALLHFTSGFLLLNAWYESRLGNYSREIAAGFLVFALFELVYTFFAARLQRRYPKLSGIIRLMAALAFIIYAWMLFHDRQHLFGIFMVLIAGLFIIIFFIEKRWDQPFILHINENGISFPRIFRYQLFSWNEFNHIILRDGLLTLDFKNNRVVQLDLDQPFNEDQTAMLNNFCQSHTDK